MSYATNWSPQAACPNGITARVFRDFVGISYRLTSGTVTLEWAAEQTGGQCKLSSQDMSLPLFRGYPVPGPENAVITDPRFGKLVLLRLCSDHPVVTKVIHGDNGTQSLLIREVRCTYETWIKHQDEILSGTFQGQE